MCILYYIGIYIIYYSCTNSTYVLFNIDLKCFYYYYLGSSISLCVMNLINVIKLNLYLERRSPSMTKVLYIT